jgi:hypothetical protein
VSGSARAAAVMRAAISGGTWMPTWGMETSNGPLPAVKR